MSANPLSDPDARATAPLAPTDITPATEYHAPSGDQSLRVTLDILSAVANVQATLATLRADLTQLRADLTQHGQVTQEAHTALGKRLDALHASIGSVDASRRGNGPQPETTNLTELETQYRAALQAHGATIDAQTGRPVLTQVSTDKARWLLMQALGPDCKAQPGQPCPYGEHVKHGAQTTAQSAVQGPDVSPRFADVRRVWALWASTLGKTETASSQERARRAVLLWLASPPTGDGMPFLPRYLLIRRDLYSAADLFRAGGDKSALTYKDALAAYPSDPGAGVSRIGA